MKISWFLLSFAALSLFSVMALLITSLVKRGYPAYFVLLGLSAVLLVFFGTQSFIGRANIPSSGWNVWGTIVAIGLLSALGNLAEANAMAQAPNPGLAKAVIAMQAGVIALISIKVFGSQINATQTAGLLVGLFAIVLLAIGAGQNAAKSKAAVETRKIDSTAATRSEASK